MIEFCFYARLDYRQFRFIEIKISNQQLGILLDLGLVIVRNKRYEEIGSWKNTQSENLMQPDD